jgi:glycosyltransferase involved in cell wall biosynthesis
MNTVNNGRSSKTVCMLSSVHPPLDIRIYHKESKTLVDAGYEVTLIVPSSEMVNSNGIRILSIPPERNRLLRMTRSVWRIYKLAKGEEAATYHLHDPELIPIGLLLLASGRHVIYDAHEDLPKDVMEKPWIPEKLRGLLSIVVDWLERVTCSRFAAVITAGDSISDRLASTGKHPITLNNYPLTNEFKVSDSLSEEQSTSNVIVSFGGLFTFRAVHPMVEAFGLLPQRLPVKLLLGGRSESDLLREELKSRPGWRRIDYRGQMTRLQMLPELLRAFAAIILFHNGPNTHSVRSNRFYEALAAGVPVITPDFGDWKSVVEGNRCGLTVSPEDPQQIADAIEWLFSHPEEAAKMGRNGRELFLREFNWEQEGKKLVRLYATLTNGSASNRS